MKKLKSIWMTLLLVILSMAIVIGGTNILAFAATEAGTSIVSNAEIPTKFVYGTSYSVDDDIVVIAPNGDDVGTVSNGIRSFTANQVGIYTLQTMENNTVAAEYNVKCSMKDGYELRVTKNGAQIPTYINKGGKFNLPTAFLYKEVDGEWKPQNNATVKISVDNVEKTAGTEIVCSEARAMSINYSVKVEGGEKYISKDFTVKVQENFEDKKTPELNVVNFPSSFDIFNKVTLPVATATDDYDENIDIVIEVRDPDGEKVKTVSVDDNGYGYIDPAKTYETIEFDNNKVMSFYPTKSGSYVVTYVGIDDSGKESAKYTYNKVQSLDSTAPVLKEIKDSQIPEVWGVTMGQNNAGTTIGSEITFPFPTYIDNSGAAGISASFEIYDTVNKVTVIKFTNIFDTAKGGNKYKYNKDSNGVYDKPAGEATATEHVFDANGFKFDFAKYVVDSDKTKVGKYTVTYQVTDAKPNISTKTYNITLEDQFNDKDKPSVTLDFDNKFIYVTKVKEDFTVPTPIVKDAKDARPNVEYTLGNGTKTIDVKGGEKGKIYINDADKIILAIEDKDELELSNSELSYSVKATDDAKNVSDVVSDDLAMITASTFTGFTPAITGSLETSLTLGATASNVGDLVFTVGDSFKDYRNYIGFELALYSDAGEILDGLNFETYFSPADKNVHVDDITFKPSVATKAGESYKLVARSFTISGKSTSQIFKFTVTDTTTGGGGISSEKVPSNGNVNVTYTLKNETYNPVTSDNIDTSKKYIVRRVTNAGRMSIMNTQFTAYTSGTVTFAEGIYQVGGGFKYIADKYTVKVSENTTPIFEMQGVIPSYSAKDTKIDLPAITAFSDYSAAKIEFTVKTPTKTFTQKDAGQNANGEYGLQYNTTTKRYALTPSEDGEYTITYTATAPGSGKTENATYKIKVGDVVPPTFTVESAHTKDVAINSTFKFKAITVGAGDDLKDVKIVKKLVTADNEEVYAVRGNASEVADKLTNGTDKNNNDDAYKFTSSGPYTVIYEVTDKVGNTSITKHTINVSGVKTNNETSMKAISVVLIIVGVLLIAGVILYFVRFRKVKPKNEK